MEANQLSNEVNLKLLLKNRYHRLDVEFATEVSLDAVDALDDLIAVADAVDLTETEQFLFSTFLANSDE